MDRERRTLAVDLDHARHLWSYAVRRRRAAACRRALLQRTELAVQHPLERIQHVELVLPAYKTRHVLPLGARPVSVDRPRLDRVELVWLCDDEAHLREERGREGPARGHKVPRVGEGEGVEEGEEQRRAGGREGKLEGKDGGGVGGEDEAVAEEELLVGLGAVRVEDLLTCAGAVGSALDHMSRAE